MADTVMDRSASIDFSDPFTYHDRVIKVGDKKFYVLSQFLSMWSKHFRPMFKGDSAEAKQTEIEIKDVEPDIFEKYLMIIYKNTCQPLVTDLIPLIHLSYRFSTTRVMDFCKKFINESFTKLGPIRLELLRTACLYDNKDLKTKLTTHFANSFVLAEINFAEVAEIVMEYNLVDLKTCLIDHLYSNLTYENCVDFLDTSVKLNMADIKDDINTKMYDLECSLIPGTLIIELTKAAIRHNVPNLKTKLREQIRSLCKNSSQIYDSTTGTYVRKTFLGEYYTDIMKLPADIKDFIILSSVDQIILNKS